MTWAPRRFLRSPKTIVAEVSMLAGAAALSTVVPQASDPKAWALFSEERPALASLCHAVFLDRVWQSPWVLVVLALALGSLGIVLREQWSRLGDRWRSQPAPGSFESAPYRLRFSRPRRIPVDGPTITVTRSARAGLLGSPLLHTGLVLVMAAGLVRVLLVAQAAVELVEGETLPAKSSSYGAHWDGLLATPFRLDSSLRLEKVTPETYPSGKLKSLAAEVAYGNRRRRVAVNEPLADGFRKLYLTTNYGPAVVLRFGGAGGYDEHLVVLHGTSETDVYAGVSTMRTGTEIRLTCSMTGAGAEHPDAAVDSRVIRGGALVFSGVIPPGQGVRLPTGEQLEIVDVRRWAEFRGTRDVSVLPAYAGFLLAAVGVTLLFAVVPVDSAVAVTPQGDDEEVLVAMWPRRFVPLHGDRFRRLAISQGAPENLLT